MSALLDHGVANEYLDTVGLRAALFAGQERERCLGPEGPRIMQELGQALLTKGRELCHGTCSKISGTVQKDGYARAHGHVDIQSDETNRRVSDSLSPFAALARELLELFQALTALLEQILIEPDCAGLKERAFAKLALLHAHVNVIEGRFI